MLTKSRFTQHQRIKYLSVRCLRFFSSDSSFQPTLTYTTHHNRTSDTCPRCSKSPVDQTIFDTSVIIPSQFLNQQTHSPQFPPSDFPFPETLTTSTASRFSFSPSTANIPSQEFNSFTTDPQSTWLPSSSSSLPAHSPHQAQYQYQDQSGPAQPSHQDFVLFESAPSVRSSPSLSNNQAVTGQYRRHSSQSSSAAALQNQRVAAIIQSTGHSISTSSLTNRYNNNNPAQSPNQQFYASSAPNSTAHLQARKTRPPVPPFSQSTGHIPQTPNMALQGNSLVSLPRRPGDSHKPADMDLFDEFTSFEGGASTQNAFPSAYSSPAVPSIYDLSANLSSSSSTNMGTVSPHDLHRNSFASAPNSTAFTNLTSPSTFDNESPEYDDNFDVSPFVGNGDVGEQSLAGDPWFPLFPQDDQLDNSGADHSPLLPEEELEVSEALRSSGGRRRSTSASSPTGTHSAVSGVRKRDKPLPPIIVEDPNDTVAMKRARNTLAARKSRQRKMQRFEELEDEIAKLKAERDHWKSIALKRN